MSDEYLAPLRTDVELATAMREEADAFAARNHLDFSTESLGALDHDLGTGSTFEMGAYLGEVIRRAEPTVHWARTERGEPGIAVGSWLADPFDQVERLQRHKATASLAEYAAGVATVASAESTEEGAAQAGLRTKRLTPWEQLVESGRTRRRTMRRP